jgi:hypothetical protein
MSGKWTGGTMDANVARLIAGGVEALTIDASTQEISLPLGLENFTAISVPGIPASGHVRIWADTTSLTMRSRSFGGIASMAYSKTFAPSNWLNSFDASTGFFAASQPAFTDISGSATNAQLPAFTGDVTKPAGSGVTTLANIPTSVLPAFTGDVTKPFGSTVQTLANIPNSTPMAGSILATNIAAPVSPGGGHAQIYVDSTSTNLCVINTIGVVCHGVQTRTATASNWIRSIADDGSSTISQPAFTDISGTVNLATQATGILPGSSLPAFTGDVTKPSASTVQTLANIPNDVPAAGDILFTDVASPTIPSAGKMRVYGDSSSGVLTAIDGSTGRSSTAIGLTAVSHQWLNSFSAITGGFTQSQPAFADISSTLLASQFTFGITLATFTFGYINSTPSPLIGTGTTVFLRPDTSATGLGGSGGLMQWHVPFALADIEVFLNVDSWADAGSGGTYSVTLMKNGATTASNVTVTSTGTKLLSSVPVTYVAGDRYGFQVTATGTVGVRTDFCLFARGKTV